jgi:hypothetical protein
VIQIDVWDAQLMAAIDPIRMAIAVPLIDSSRILSAMSKPPRLDRLQPNVFGLGRVGAGFEVIAVDRLDDVGTRLVEDLVAALEIVEIVEEEDTPRQRRAGRCHSGVGLQHWVVGPRKTDRCGDAARGCHAGLTLAW